AGNQTALVNKALGGNYFDTSTGSQLKPFTPTPITNPIIAPSPGTTGTPPPTLPTPQAPAINQTFLNGVAGDLASAKTNLENTYNTQITDLKNQEDTLKTTIASADTNLSGLQTSNW